MAYQSEVLPLGSLGMNVSPSSAVVPRRSILSVRIDELWERRAELDPDDVAAREIVTAAVDALDTGAARVAWPDPDTGEIVVDERAKRAILLAFRLHADGRTQVGDFRYHDRVPLTSHLDGVRAVAGSIVRWGAYVAPGVVLMPSFVNIGAYVDTGTMVDTWATVGSVRADRQERPPVRRGRHRRRARAAERGAGGRRGRCVHRLAVHGGGRARGSAPARCSGAGTILTRAPT